MPEGTYWISCITNLYFTTAALPVFTKRPVHVESLTGGLATLNCSARGYPSPLIVWYRDGSGRVNESIRVKIIPHQAANNSLSKLHFTRLQLSDAGSYYCTTRNDLPLAVTVTSGKGNLTVLCKLETLSLAPAFGAKAVTNV